MTSVHAVQTKIKSLPLTSGVYLMKDSSGTIIYVGKAVSLRRRVQSYFRGKSQGFKTDQLVINIADIDHIKTHSEAEALILEASLVRKLQPKYNIDLKDDKTYPYIQISNDKFPLVTITRLSPRDGEESSLIINQNKIEPSPSRGGGRLFGPYTDSTLIREALTLIRKIFPFRSCDPLPDKACLYHDIGLCEAPCIGKVSVIEYRRTIKHIVRVLEGEQDKLYSELKAEMEGLAKDKDFEGAAKTRDQLRAIGALYSSSPEVNYFKEAEQLERALHLPKSPERIECIDISTTMGERAVGSLVSFANGKPDKANYRRFRIKEVQGMDDFKMVAEVVRRRYGRLKREGAPYPDLVMIDGGKGQLSSAYEELKALDIDIPLISLAKREEEVFMPGKRAPVLLSRDSLALKLLQRVRDEAHRFAIAYHRLLRGKKIFE
ncbi:MAG: excinuclease ABC subunit UvrC [Candidatus Omnitrophica bacterium]|nr:excinuclease ABC subunit UvrC [Candidatus Omnitrophota bacterium]